MTPEEKALELVSKMISELGTKECALIAVDEIIKDYFSIDFMKNPNPVEYWQAVKDEIEKI